MIYLDNSATTYPKPLSVRRKMAQALEQFGANPGRGGSGVRLVSAELHAVAEYRYPLVKA